jgi:hypothetical protein
MIVLAAENPNPSDILLDLHSGNDPDAGLNYFFMAVGIIIALILIWAVFIRKRRDDRDRSYKYPKSSAASDDQKHSGRRRKRRRSRPLNPTRAETGGLPPPRQEIPAGDPP